MQFYLCAFHNTCFYVIAVSIKTILTILYFTNSTYPAITQPRLLDTILLDLYFLGDQYLILRQFNVWNKNPSLKDYCTQFILLHQTFRILHQFPYALLKSLYSTVLLLSYLATSFHLKSLLHFVYRFDILLYRNTILLNF